MKSSLAQRNFVPGASRGPRRAATLLAQMADLERGDRIKSLRDGLHLTQPVVADRVGVTLRGYQEWEAGGGIQWENAKRLAKVLRTTPDYVMSGEPLATPSPFGLSVEQRLEHIEQQLDQLLSLFGGKPDAAATISDAIAAAVDRALNRRATEVGRPTRPRQRPQPAPAPQRAA